MKKNHKLLIAILGLISFQTNVYAFNFTALPAVPNKINEKYFTFELKPGDTAQETLFVQNNGSKEAIYKIDAVDSIPTKDGQMGFNLANFPQSGVGKWANIEEREITLKPGEKKVIGFTISIPSDQSIGDYTGGITVTTKADSQKDTDNKVVIGINQRYVIKTFVKVTDNPKIIEKAGINETKSSWTQYYLIASATIFIIVVSVFLVKSKQKPQATK